jgi:hypothetical protein
VCSTLRPSSLSLDNRIDRRGSSAGESKTEKKSQKKREKKSEKRSGPRSRIRSRRNMVLVYGGNAEGLPVGNAQRDVASNFPEQFQEIRQRLAMESTTKTTNHEMWEVITSSAHPLRHKGCGSWNETLGSKKCLTLEIDGGEEAEEAEEDDENATMRLVHCTVFPRNAVAEQKICRSVFRRAVEEILPLCSNRTEEDEDEDKNEVVHLVTHGIGVFTGHPDPGAFARSMADGLGDVLSDLVALAC